MDLNRRSHEDEETFQLRSRYVEMALSSLPDQINMATATLLADMAINKIKLGVKYAQELEDVITYINMLITQNAPLPTSFPEAETIETAAQETTEPITEDEE